MDGNSTKPIKLHNYIFVLFLLFYIIYIINKSNILFALFF